MSTSVILVFAFGTDLLRLRNVGSFRQKCSGRCTPHEVRRWPPCPGRAKRDLGPRVTRRHVSTVHRFCRLALGPGSSLSLRARSSGTRGRWRALFAQAAHNAALPIFPSHDVKQRSLGRSRGALLRPGSRFSFRVHPRMRGGRSADRRTIFVVAFARRDGSARVRRGASHDAGRSPLGAPPWRFSAGGRASISGIASGSVQRAPRSQVVMPGGRCPGPPEPAVTSRGRRTPLPAPPSGSSPKTPLHERGWQKVLYIRYVVK